MGSVKEKLNVLLLGGGAVGAIAALNIEAGGLGSVTAVLRSNFNVVTEEGYTIESVDHGNFKGWRPTKGMYSCDLTTRLSQKRGPTRPHC